MDKKELFWLNGWISEKELSLSHNRAFLYGDGFFESMRWKTDGSSPLWHFHWERLSRTLKVLNFPVPDFFTEAYFKSLIEDQLPQNPDFDSRVKVQFWRHGEGKYQPENTRLAFMMTVEPYPFPWIQTIEKVGIAESVFIPWHPLSWIKTTSSMLNVAAATERVNRGLDDVVLKNEQGFVIEGSYSCLFWMKDNVVFLPDHGLGGLDSCMRKFLLQFWKEQGIPTQMVNEKWTEIPEVDWIGFGSGMGLRVKMYKEADFVKWFPEF